MTARHTILSRIARAAIPLAAAGLAGVPFAAAQTTVATGHRDILLQADHSWNGQPYRHYPTGTPQLTLIRLTIPPHTALPWHTHPVPNAGYVLEGQLTITDRDSGKSHIFHTGEAFAESVNDVHRGESGDTRTVLLIAYSGTPGTPTSVPAKGEKPEY
jgi:quercetin dioxygenase-like cupin family protein